MRLLQAYLRFCQRFAWQILIAVSLITVLAGFLAQRLTIEGDVSRLLPASAPSVAGLDRLEKAYGGQVGRLTVVLEREEQAETSEHLEEIVDELAVGLRELPNVQRVETHRPVEFFEQHRLLYADVEDLEEARDIVSEHIKKEKAQANPLFVGLGDDADDADLEEELSELLDPERLGEKYQILAESPYYISDDGQMLAIFIYPEFPASALSQAAELIDQVDDYVDDWLKTNPLVEGEEMSFGLTGRYKKRVDLEGMLKRDLGLSSSLALSILLVFLLSYLRSFRATILVITPLIVGTIWTFAWAEIAFGSLNMMTAFLGAVLMGLGVDYGIHLFSRFRELRQGRSAEEALYETMASTGRANISAALTTMVALGSLMISGFRAFFEFGVIAVGGLPLILLAYLLLFPCALMLAERYEIDITRSKFLWRGGLKWDERVVGWLLPGGAKGAQEKVNKLGKIATGALIVVMLLGVLGLPQLQFIRAFSVLESTSAPSWLLDERINELLGQSQIPTLVLADSQEDADKVVEELERRKALDLEDSAIDQVISLQTFVPAEQAEKREILADIQEKLADVPESRQSEDFQEYQAEVARLLEEEELSAADLPAEIRDQLSRVDAPDKRVVLVFPTLDLGSLESIDLWAETLKDLPGAEPGAGYDAISESFLLRDIIHTSEEDATLMLIITALGLVVLSYLTFRNLRLTAVQLGALIVALMVGLGMNGLFGSHFNFMNMVALPIWLGLGVDATFYILVLIDTHREADEPGELRDYLFSHVHLSGAISAAYLTSMVGFGTLLFAQHNGLRSLGKVAIFGLGSILLVNLLLQMILGIRSMEELDKSD